MRFTRQARNLSREFAAHDVDGVDLELRAPRVKISLRVERHQWFVLVSWLTDRRRWVVAYEWKVWGRDGGVELVKFLETQFGRWHPEYKAAPSPIPEWLQEFAKAGMAVPIERLMQHTKPECSRPTKLT